MRTNDLRKLELKSAKEEYEKLSKQIFPDLHIGILHGQLKSREKERTMQAFQRREIDVLVSTSVVEVGIDISNATIMMIEGSERFGLAQLYQFRGRVGRGEHQSYCLLFTDSNSEATRERLQAIVNAKNGFELAEVDLKLRGPGQFLGTEQTGLPDYAMQGLQDPELIASSRRAAQTTIQNDPKLKNFLLLKERLSALKQSTHLE